MKVRKKPVIVDAIKYHMYCQSEIDNIRDFMGGVIKHYPSGEIHINTLEGVMVAIPGDWIIKGIKGEFYPCKSDIFDLTYEPIIE